MCLVIDTNQAADFCKQQKPFLQCLLGWINSGGRIVSGGDLERELFRVSAMRTLALEWSRRGNLIRLNPNQLMSERKRIEPLCRSDDPHVLAVTVIGRADVVVTADNLLIKDLKDSGVVGHRRRIYKENAGNPNRIDRHLRMLRGLDCPG